MVVKSEIKLIKSLHQKKYRSLNGLFVAEGFKMVSDLLQSQIRPHKIYCTDPALLKSVEGDKALVSEAELKKISGLKSPNLALGVFHIPESKPLDFSDWVLALDRVQDPGNLGTIIRLCDWFGIQHLLCSPDTADCYNPKVLQATMGSIARVNIVYSNLPEILERAGVEVYGAFMDGSPVVKEEFPASGILVMGNEANGISAMLEEKITTRVGIPPYQGRVTESLNVATATAVLLHEIRRPTQM